MYSNKTFCLSYSRKTVRGIPQFYPEAFIEEVFYNENPENKSS